MAFEKPGILEDMLIGQTCSSVKLFNVNDDYYRFNAHTLIVDGAVELDFGSFQITLGFNEDLLLMDAVTGSAAGLIGNLDYYQVDTSDVQNSDKMLGRRVDHVHVKWNFYHDLDEYFNQTETVHYIIEELVLSFDDGSQLQAAAIDFSIENGKVVDLVFNSEQAVLVSFNSRVAIGSFGE